MTYKVLDDELKKRGMNLNQLSMEAKISASGLYAAVKGSTPFWPGWKGRIATALEMPVEELFPEEDFCNED